MLENHDYDYYLDLCLDILSEEKYKNILKEMINMDKRIWIKMNTIQELSLFPNSIYFLCESLPNFTDLLFVFINMDTFEINTTIYYITPKPI